MKGDILKDLIIKEVDGLRENIIEWRCYLHKNAEVGFELKKTVEFVKDKLTEFGCEVEPCGKNGLVTVIGDKDNVTILLRADMDALPVKEETELEFSCETGNMHACGHDMHTAMLLASAKLLKNHEKDLKSGVKLMFQPAEETLSGAKNMLENGLLKGDTIKAAMMLHVMAGLPLKTGTVIVSSGGIGAPTADYFTVNIQGKGCHGSTPQQGVDALNIASHIVIALQEISARELGLSDEALLTIGCLKAGTAGNVIADTAVLEGTMRAYDDNVRDYIKKRLTEICSGVALTFRGKADVTFGAGCPTLLNDANLSEIIENNTIELLGKEQVFNTNSFGARTNKSGGSEDFSYISHQVPSVMVALASGNSEEGYVYPQHHPKVKFDESVLSIGCAVFTYNAIKLSEKLK